MERAAAHRACVLPQGAGKLDMLANEPAWEEATARALAEQKPPKYRPGSAGSVATQRAPLQPRMPDSYGFLNVPPGA